MIAIDCYWLPLIAIDCHLLTLRELTIKSLIIVNLLIIDILLYKGGKEYKLVSDIKIIAEILKSICLLYFNSFNSSTNKFINNPTRWIDDKLIYLSNDAIKI